MHFGDLLGELLVFRSVLANDVALQEHLACRRAGQGMLLELLADAQAGISVPKRESEIEEISESIGLTLYQISCRSFVGAVNFISRCGVDTTTLYGYRPGGYGLGSSTERTDSIYAMVILAKKAFEDEQ